MREKATAPQALYSKTTIAFPVHVERLLKRQRQRMHLEHNSIVDLHSVHLPLRSHYTITS